MMLVAFIAGYLVGFWVLRAKFESPSAAIDVALLLIAGFVVAAIAGWLRSRWSA